MSKLHSLPFFMLVGCQFQSLVGFNQVPKLVLVCTLLKRLHPFLVTLFLSIDFSFPPSCTAGLLMYISSVFQYFQEAHVDP